MKTHTTERSSSREVCDQICPTPDALGSFTDSKIPVNQTGATAGSDCPQLFLQVSENKVKLRDIPNRYQKGSGKSCSRYKCQECELSFDNFGDLSEHIVTSHESESYPCEECETIFLSLPALEYHFEEEHLIPPHAQLGDLIPQYDGPGQEANPYTGLPGTTSVRTASFTFNQAKQTEKITRDATLNDYEVNVNNSDENATVKCSSGFYIQVARASLGSLKNHSVLPCGDVAITVDNVTVTKDQIGTEATKLISFSFMSDQRSLGGVTVHQHHSSRTIQIQGSAIMPDSTKAALWFLKNFVLVRFQEQAKAKNFAIRNTNKVIINATAKHQNLPHESSNSCFSCNRGFNNKSKPSKCDKCGNYFHKTSCLKEHVKLCHPSSQLGSRTSVSLTTAFSASSLSTAVQSTPIFSGSSFSGIRSTLTFIPRESTASSTGSTTLAASTVLSASSSTTASISSSSTVATSAVGSFPPQPTVTSMAASAGPSTTSSLSALVSTVSSVDVVAGAGTSSTQPSLTNSAPTTKPRAKKNPKPFIPISAEQARINFLQTELSAAQTRIVQQDADIVDKDRRVSVLMARIKIFEDEQTKTLHEKYFQSGQSHQNSSTVQHSEPTPIPPRTARVQASCAPTCPNCSPPLCCQQQGLRVQHCLCHAAHNHLPVQPSMNADLLSSITGLQTQVDVLTKNSSLFKLALQSIEEKLSSIPPPLAAVSPTAPVLTTSAVDDVSDDANIEPQDPDSKNTDDTITSIEEFMSDDTQAPPVSLNWQLLTSQQ